MTQRKNEKGSASYLAEAVASGQLSVHLVLVAQLRTSGAVTLEFNRHLVKPWVSGRRGGRGEGEQKVPNLFAIWPNAHVNFTKAASADAPCDAVFVVDQSRRHGAELLMKGRAKLGRGEVSSSQLLVTKCRGGKGQTKKKQLTKGSRLRPLHTTEKSRNGGSARPRARQQ